MKPLSPSALRASIAAAGNSPYLVSNLIPSSSVIIFAGESGLGKTPILVQLSICIAAGLPFLGHTVRQGPVVYLDLEQSPEKFNSMCQAVSTALGLCDTPENFYRLGVSTIPEIEAAVKEVQPSLLVIDTLRLLDTDAEKDNSCAARRINWMRKFIKNGTVVIFIHHMRKDNEDAPRPWLGDEKHRVLSWMAHASGASALVNNTDVRIGFDEGRNDYDSILRGYIRAKDEFGPIRLRRILHDSSGDPQAYEISPEVEKLRPQFDPFISKLPLDPFTFKQAYETIGRSKKFTITLLRSGMASGHLIRVGEGIETRYERVK